MLVVLALDALDHEHVGHFGTEELELNQHRPIETFSYMNDQPYTLEVWPTVATGLGPREHGVTGEGTSEWDNPLVEAASAFTSKLSGNTRDKLGRLAESLTGASYGIPETDTDHVFKGPGRVLHNWPGVYNSQELQRVWALADPEKSEGTVAEFSREVYGIGAEQFGWVREMLNHDLTLVGCHIHTLDMCGHIFRDDKERYRQTYEWVANHVDKIQADMSEEDELLLLGDHGIHTSWDSSDVEPSRHSERAMAATTVSEELFESVYEVRPWIERVIEDLDQKQSKEEIDVPTDQLEDLGYV